MKAGRWIIALLVCTLLVLALGAYKALEISSAIEMAENYPEHSETVTPFLSEPVSYQPSLQVMGEIVTPEHIIIRNELPARVTDVRVRPGQVVAENQVLFQLDVTEELAQQQSARARLELAELKLRRIKRLRHANSVSQSELDEAVAEQKVILSELAVLASTIEKKNLRAPFAGEMGLHNIERGSYLQANTEIGPFVGNQPWVWVEFAIPQFYPALEKDSEVSIQPLVAGSSPVTARIVARDTVISTNTRTHQYRARIEEREDNLTHNTAVQVIVPRGSEQSLVSVAIEAVQHDQHGAFVYLLNSEPGKNSSQRTKARAERKNVVVYKREGEQVLIAQGLEGGESLAAIGAFKLYPGVLVNLASAPADLAESDTRQPYSEE